MVIQVRGTDLNENKAAHMTAVLSAVSASKKSRKTLVMQLNKKSSIEDLLVGKKNAEVDIRDIGFVYEDSGMDAIFTRVGAMKLQKEHFDACFSSIMDKENMLDIAGASKSEDFESTLIEEEEKLETLILQAKDVYDDIFIYSNGENAKLLSVINKYTDVVFVCVRQGSVENVSEVPENSTYLVTNYDKDSIYSIRSLKKLYKTQKMFGIPYNCEFKDAYNNANIMGFLAKNEKISEDDINYPFINTIISVLDQYIEDKTEEQKDAPLPEPFPDEVVEDDEIEDFEEPPVEVVEKKKGLGKKTKVVQPKPVSRYEEPEIEYLDDEDDEDIEVYDMDDEDDDYAEPVRTKAPEKHSRHDRKQKESRKMRKKSAVEEAKEILMEEDAPVAKRAERPAMRPATRPVEKPAEEAKEWTCPSCGEINPNKAKFCMECGTTKPVVPTKWTCPNCGEINPPKAKFCMECGTTKA